MIVMNRLLFISIALSALVAAGCDSGPATGTVSGKVTTADGKPLTGGRIDFFSAEAGQESGQINADGTYLVEALTTGEKKVAIVNMHLKGVKPGPAGLEPMPGADLTYVPIPAKFADAEKSGLTTTVQSGAQTYDVQLTK